MAKGRVQYVIRQLAEDGTVLKEIANTKEIPEKIRDQEVGNIQLYFHGEEPGKSPYKSLALLKLVPSTVEE